MKNLSVAVNPKKPSVTLTWSCPDNCVNAGDIKRYHIHFCAMICNDLGDSQNDVEDFMDLTTMICDFLETQMTSGSVEVLGSLTEVTLDRSDDLIPMLKYAFEVQAESQQGSLGEAQLATIYLGKCNDKLSLHRTYHSNSITIFNTHNCALCTCNILCQRSTCLV